MPKATTESVRRMLERYKFTAKPTLTIDPGGDGHIDIVSILSGVTVTVDPSNSEWVTDLKKYFRKLGIK